MARMTRLWSIFDQESNGKWRRISTLSFDKNTAVRVFQNKLLEPYLVGPYVKRELRPIKDGEDDYKYNSLANSFGIK